MHGQIKNLNDKELIRNTTKYVKEEREILTKVLHHLKEIERRRLYSDYKYSSLLKMLTGHFGYSDDEAYRRISAMRLLKEIPEVEEKINDGKFSLSHMGLAQTFFRREQTKDKQTKLDLLNAISEKPFREAQRIVVQKSSNPSPPKPDKIKPLPQNKIEMRITADQELEEKLTELRGLLAHKHPNITRAELLLYACQTAIDTIKADKTATSRKPRVQDKKTQAAVERAVWKKSQHKCENCGSNHALEIDHRQPKAKGGNNSEQNLRILCRSCNQREAIKHFGIKKMEGYLESKSKN